MAATSGESLPSIQHPSILLVLAITLPALLLAIQVIASEGYAPHLPKLNSTTDEQENNTMKGISSRFSTSNNVEKNDESNNLISPSLISLHSAHSFPHMHRPSTSTSLYTRPSTSTKEPRQSYDPLVDVSRYSHAEVHATSSPRPRWKRALSMTTFHPKLLLLSGRQPSLSEKGEQKHSRVPMGERCCKSLDLESGYGHHSVSVKNRRKISSNHQISNSASSVVDMTMDYLSSQIISHLIPSVSRSRLLQSNSAINCFDIIFFFLV